MPYCSQGGIVGDAQMKGLERLASVLFARWTGQALVVVLLAALKGTDLHGSKG